MTLFKRIVRVHTAGLMITEPRISGHVERQSDDTQAVGKVEIYNLSPEHERQIYERGEIIRIEAGYPETIAVLFQGVIQHVLRGRKNLAHVTEITLGDFSHALNTLGGISSRSWAGPEQIRSVVTDLVADMGLELGPLDAIPATATVTDYAWAGSAAGGLTDVLKYAGILRAFIPSAGQVARSQVAQGLAQADAAGVPLPAAVVPVEPERVSFQRVPVRWFEDDGVIRFGDDQPQVDAPTITVSPQTGLVDIPEETDEGYEVTMFLNPFARVGGIIDLWSRDVNGMMRIVGLRHNFDNWEGSFTTWTEVREQ